MAYRKDPEAERPAVGTAVPLGSLNCRIGQAHGRAKLTDHDVELILSLLEARDVLIDEYRKVGLGKRQIEKALHTAQLSYSGIAEKFEISKSHIRWIALGLQRGQPAVRWKSVCI